MGSRVPYIERRIALLRELEKHRNIRVRQIAKTLIDGFEAEKKQELKKDEERHAGIY